MTDHRKEGVLLTQQEMMSYLPEFLSLIGPYHFLIGITRFEISAFPTFELPHTPDYPDPWVVSFLECDLQHLEVISVYQLPACVLPTLSHVDESPHGPPYPCLPNRPRT